MDELLDLFETFVESFNRHAAACAAINATQVELAGQLQALSDKLGELLDEEGGEEAEEEGGEESGEEEPAVSCHTCAFFGSANGMCHKWNQTPPEAVLAIGCHEWIISPAAFMPTEADPEPEPEPVKPTRGRKQKNAPQPSGKKTKNLSSLETVPF